MDRVLEPDRRNSTGTRTLRPPIQIQVKVEKEGGILNPNKKQKKGLGL